MCEKTGKPIEGAYADLNHDGQINSSDLYRYKSPAPDYIMGLSSSLRYKKFTFSASFRANIGNYVYNGMAMSTGAWETVSYNSYQLNNLNNSYVKTGFQTRQYLSDYYVENASFLKRLSGLRMTSANNCMRHYWQQRNAGLKRKSCWMATVRRISAMSLSMN